MQSDSENQSRNYYGSPCNKPMNQDENIMWLMEQIEARCQDKDAANLRRHHGRFDLELVISVAPQDRSAIDDEFLVDMKRAMRERTGCLAPVIYLDGVEPEAVRTWDPYY